MNKGELIGGEVVIYRSKDGKSQFEVKMQNESLWLDAHQMASIFDIDRTVVVKHIANIYKSGELKPISTCAKIAQVAADGKKRKMNYYNLDMVISAGYRVNSKRATQFRIWATSVLKDHLLKGYTFNKQRLREKGLNEFEEAVALIKKTLQSRELTGSEAKGLLEVITNYASTWVLLQKFDQSELPETKTKKSTGKFGYDFCRGAIDQLKDELVKKREATNLFGNERDDQFKGIIGNLYQTFDKYQLYPSIDEKAAHLLYFVIKDHPFTDGNKRIGSFLFIVFLAKNRYLYKKNGEKKINDNALTALALLIAQSDPKDKKLMILLIMNFLAE